ncbi:MAG TPA: DUF6152 family protein [Gammaproteobacteria bacterium]
MGVLRTLVSASAGLAFAVAWACVHAHHSFSAEFDIGQPVEITGTVTDIEWTNPHTWVHMEVTDADGNRSRWAVELLGVNSLARSGLTRRTLKPGDAIKVKGYRARNGTNTANASSMVRADTGEPLWTSTGEQE